MGINGYETDDRETYDSLMVRKCFTLEEANATLPLVHRIVRDIVEQYREVAKLQDQLQEIWGDDAADLIDEIESKRNNGLSHLKELSEELSDIGCELKDWELGLIDFPALHRGEEIYLCWRLGEDRIAYWHEVDAGFAGRTPIEPGLEI